MILSQNSKYLTHAKYWQWYKISVFLLFIQSLGAWFTANIITTAVIMLLSICSGFMFFSSLPKHEIEKSTSSGWLLFMLVCNELYVFRYASFGGMTICLLTIICLWLVMRLPSLYKIDLLHFITNTFSGLLVISITAWFLFLCHIPLPYIINENQSSNCYPFYNYIFFIVPMHLSTFPRFCSVFGEPGHLGMMTSLLLFANMYCLTRHTQSGTVDGHYGKRRLFNWHLSVIALSMVCSLSLAGYLLTLAGLILYRLGFHLRSFLILIMLVSVYIVGVSYNGGDNPLNNEIISRMHYDDEKILSGNNRYGIDFMDYYDNYFWSSGKVLFGLSPSEIMDLNFQTGNAGYKLYLLQGGIVGSILIFLLYLNIFIVKPSRIGFFFLIIYALSFLQRAYLIWPCQIILFIIAIDFFKKNALPAPHIKE